MSAHPIDKLCDEMSLLERLRQTEKAYEFELNLTEHSCPELVDDIAHIRAAIAQLQTAGKSVIGQWSTSSDERQQMYAAADADFSVLKF